MAKAMDVADDIITVAEKQGNPVSNLVLQKTMYFLNASAYVEKGKPLIKDKRFEKWDYGPVIPDVYFEYSNNGASTISAPATHQSVSFNEKGFPVVTNHDFNQATFNQEHVYESTYISKNLNRLLKFNPWVLVDKSHLEPQWSRKMDPFYNMQETLNFYKQKGNMFW